VFADSAAARADNHGDSDHDSTADGAHIGTYALVVLDVQIAGYGRDVSCFILGVMCAELVGANTAARGRQVR
jgi:hypothetical protein